MWLAGINQFDAIKLGVVLMVLLSWFGSCSKKLSTEQFWQWFTKNESMCFEFERDQDRTFHKLGKALSKYHPSLGFEFGSVENGKREFVISADGDREAFPAVEALFEVAPELERWTFIKYRPRRTPLTVGMDDFKLSPTDVEVMLSPDGEKVGLTVYVKGYVESNRDLFLGPVFIMLDWTIGEFDMATEVGFIECRPFEQEPNAERHNLDSLPQAFDRHLGRPAVH